MEPKNWYESKVIIANLLAAVVPVVSVYSPAVAEFVKEHFLVTGMGWALVNIVLRAMKSNIVF